MTTWEAFILGAEFAVCFITASIGLWLRRLWNAGKLSINGKSKDTE